MATSFLESLGLDPDPDTNFELMNSAQVLGMDMQESPVNDISVWGVYPDPSGANFGFFVTSDEVQTDFYSVRGTRGQCATVTRLTPGLAEVQPVSEDDEPLTRLLVAVDDPALYPPTEIILEEYFIGAIAEEMTVFDSVDEWKKHQEPIKVGEGLPEGVGQELYLGPGFVTSPWLFALAEDPDQLDRANPIAILNAECETVELVTNELTGKKWYRVEISCGFPLTLALPADTTPAPHPGSMVEGEVFLTGSTGHWYE